MYGNAVINRYRRSSFFFSVKNVINMSDVSSTDLAVDATNKICKLRHTIITAARVLCSSAL